MKRPSLKLRITGWFALMMFVIEALVLAFLLAVNGTVATNDPEARLVRMVEHNADRVKYNHRQFRYGRIHYYRSGVYTVLYDADGNVLQGTFPAEFTPAQPLPLDGESVRLVDCGDNAYYVYDVHVDMMVGSVWLRGVINADANGGVMRVILPLAWSLLPVLLVASIVFAVLATLESKQKLLFLWNLSVLLASADLPAFPLACALPLKRIAARLAKSGSAVAGFAGADAIRRSNCVILTDGDLFPPGTVTLAGLKVFGEESGKVISYAATMARASESGLTKLFDDLLARDGGFREPVEDVDFFEEGGVGGRIHGETVLFGTASFMRKRGVNLPRNLGLKTGVFLSVDGTLIAVFAVKYMPAENVDWALHALHHSRITPVLAVRDGNITPALLQRQFGTHPPPVYP